MAEVPMRTLTKQDWHALHLVYRLFCEVATHGHVALDKFVAAIRASQAGEDTP